MRSQLAFRMVVSLGLVACGGAAGDDDTTATVTRVALPQALGGAMFANPDAYPTIPVHVAVDATGGEPPGVTVAVDGQTIAALPDAAGTGWVAQVPIAALADGDHALVATSGAVSAAAQLVIGRAGVQYTQISVDGNAGTPRLHRAGDRLFLTWTDRSATARVAWKQEIDGAGRRVGDKVALAGGPGRNDVLYARTALGSATIGVVYQEAGGPYRSFFTIVALDGTTQLAPVALDPPDRFGSHSGDVVFTGDGYDVVWRTNDGMGSSDVRWLHAAEAATSLTTAPLIAAARGDGAPHAGFDPFTNVSVRRLGDASLVAFVRYRHDAALDLDLPRCQLATIRAGAVVSTELVDAGGGFFWDDDCRVLDDGTGPVVARAGKDLTSSEDNPRAVMFLTRVPLAPSRGAGAVSVSAPETRSEPTLVATAAAPILAWSDARSYADDLSTGEVELYAAPLGADLVTAPNVGFAHTHFIESTADIRGAALGTNAMLVWIDERHGGTILDPRPEVYLETAWQ
ncbi:MAG: hypothetical protein KF773_26740 [Deltaproteobacteria bacterium]|nr:hypothetical protein [Deltaproteobacteria bacterium]